MDRTATRVDIRSFTTDDYAAVTRLFNLNYPDFQKEPDEVRFEDESAPAHCRWRRWVADCDGYLVGFAGYRQNPGTYHPRKFSLWMGVDPDWYLRGTGRRLYQVVLDAVERLDPLTLDAWCRDDMPCLLGFLERRGFVRDMLVWTSVLDLASFDPSIFADVVPDVEASGIQLRSVAQLGVADQVVHHKIYDMWSAIREDVPIPPGEERAEVPFERWFARFDRRELLPAGYMLAVDGDQLVGTSQLWRAPAADELRTGLTGVRREYRRRGIAFALKVHALDFAKKHGYRRVLTENESNNRGMLAINERLGFVKKPVWGHYLKTFAG